MVEKYESFVQKYKKNIMQLDGSENLCVRGSVFCNISYMQKIYSMNGFIFWNVQGKQIVVTVYTVWKEDFCRPVIRWMTGD
jgi:hypothetical protein